MKCAVVHVIVLTLSSVAAVVAGESGLRGRLPANISWLAEARAREVSLGRDCHKLGRELAASTGNVAT